MITMPETSAAVKPALDIESIDSLTASTASKTYFVSPNGNDNSPGTESQPFRTIQKAANVAQAGDTVNVMNGNYHEAVTISRDGTENNPITFQAYPGHKPIIDGRAGEPTLNSGLPYGPDSVVNPANAPIMAGAVSRDTNLVSINAGYITWNGINIYRSMGRGITVWNYNRKISHINIKNCEISDCRNSGIVFEVNSDNCILDNVHVHHTGMFAPYARGASVVDWPGGIVGKSTANLTIKNCTVRNAWGESILVDANDGGSNNITIQDCVFWDNFAAIGLHGVSNLTFQRNYIYRSTTDKARQSPFAHGPTAGIVVVPTESTRYRPHDSKDIVIRNNIIVEPWDGITLRGGASGEFLRRIKIYNNTIINAHPSGPGAMTFYAENIENIEIRNNIVYNNNGAPVSNVDSQIKSQVSLSNNYWSSAPNGRWIGSNSIVSNTSPVVNANHSPAEGQGKPENYKLVADSKAINAGVTLTGFSDDYFFNTRSGAWDIGAHEFDGKPANTITADFIASPTGGAAPLDVQFTDQSKANPTISAWLWDFGDGSAPSMRQNPTHTYQETGQFTVKLQVNGPAGEDIATKPNYITVTKAEAPPPPPAITTQRVATGLQVLYHFDEGSGLLVADHSGAGTPLNLTLEDGGAVRWLAEGGLELRSPARLKTDGAARKVIDACRQANAVTVEAWLKPANVTQSGPARILSISGGSTARNVMLGQGLWGNQPADLFDARLRTTERDANGAPSVSSPAGTAVPALTHVVYTRAQDGTATIYVNGAAVVADKVPGDFSNWDAGFPLLLGNENGESRPWLGELHLAAIYARALSAAEIAQNYAAGHRPARPATVTADFAIPPAQAQGVSPHAVAFDATASSATRGIAKYRWAFGDGGTAESANPIYTYTYKRHGLFDVTLEVVDGEGASDRLTRAQLIQVEPAPTRVTDGLQALYTFLEGQGAVVRDVSQVGQALDLTIRDAAAVRWLPDGLAVEAPTEIVSAGAAGKIISACKASHALTVEAWLTPANAAQQGPARIVSISKDPYERNVTLAQGLWAQQPPDVYDVRLRTTQTSANGTPSLTSPAGSLKAERTHVVYTRGANGQTRIYLNGKLAVEAQSAGDFSSWDDGYGLRLVSEGAEEAGRSWLGTLHLAAIYARDLSGDEVTQNYRAGLTEVEKEYTPTLLPDAPATFRRFLLLRPEDGSAGAENGSAPPAPTGYGVQYPDLRCVLLWQGAEEFEIYADLAALQAAYPRAEAALIWLDT